MHLQFWNVACDFEFIIRAVHTEKNREMNPHEQIDGNYKQIMQAALK